MRQVRTGTQNRNLEPGNEEAAMEEQFLLPFFPILAYPAFSYNPDLPTQEVKPSTVDWPLNYQPTINKHMPHCLAYKSI